MVVCVCVLLYLLYCVILCYHCDFYGFTCITYAAGPVKSMVDYIIAWQEDKAKVRNVKVIPNAECVPEHKLLVMDMQFTTRKRRHKKFEPRVCVWKLKEEIT